MKKITLIALAVATLSLLVQAQDRSNLWQQDFDKVWSTVKEKHYDATFNGVDWDKVRSQYEPRLKAIKSDRELYSLLQQMLGELGQSHFAIIPPQAVVDTSASEDPNSGLGIDLRIVDGQAVITRVSADSAAARAGLRPGFVIKQVGETQTAQIIERVAQRSKSKEIAQITVTRALLARLSGRPGTTIRLSYLDERDKARQITLTCEPLKGEMSEPFGNFPAQHTEFEARRVEGNIGYIRFNIFVPLLTPKILKAIRDMNDTPGIIFDLRGNPGGLGAMSSGITGHLETREISLGRMSMRRGYLNFPVYPQKNPYAGKIVVLIDGGSASTSEIFAAGLQEIGRAVVVGERSAGAALPSIFDKLLTGALFQYAVADFKTPKGNLVEGQGVRPDVEVRHSRAALLLGRDLQLDAAIEQVKKLAGSVRSTTTGVERDR